MPIVCSPIAEISSETNLTNADLWKLGSENKEQILAVGKIGGHITFDTPASQSLLIQNETCD